MHLSKKLLLIAVIITVVFIVLYQHPPIQAQTPTPTVDLSFSNINLQPVATIQPQATPVSRIETDSPEPAPPSQAELQPLAAWEGCAADDDLCLQPPDCVDNGAICYYEARPGPYDETESSRGLMHYVRVDLTRGAYFDNMLAGDRLKMFCQREANHIEMGEPASYKPFLAWANFDPSLTEPADLTVIERNRTGDNRNLHYNTVLGFSRQRDFSGRQPFFVINSSFFTPESAPEGSQWRNGEMLRVDPNRTMIAFSADGRRAEILWGDGAPALYGQPHPPKPPFCLDDGSGYPVEVAQLAEGADVSWIHNAIGGGPVFIVRDSTDLDANGRPRVKIANPWIDEPNSAYVPINPLGESFGQPGGLYENEDTWGHRRYMYFSDNPHTFVCVGDSVTILGVAHRMSGLDVARILVQEGCHTAMGMDDNSSSGFAWRGEFGRSLREPDQFRWISNAIGVFSREAWPEPEAMPVSEALWLGKPETTPPPRTVSPMALWVPTSTGYPYDFTGLANVGQPVRFRTFESDRSPYASPEVEWTFGDGTQIHHTLRPSHTYRAAGVYTVTLTLTETTGFVVTDSLRVTVR